MESAFLRTLDTAFLSTGVSVNKLVGAKMFVILFFFVLLILFLSIYFPFFDIIVDLHDFCVALKLIIFFINKVVVFKCLLGLEI